MIDGGGKSLSWWIWWRGCGGGVCVALEQQPLTEAFVSAVLSGLHRLGSWMFNEDGHESYGVLSGTVGPPWRRVYPGTFL